MALTEIEAQRLSELENKYGGGRSPAGSSDSLLSKEERARLNELESKYGAPQDSLEVPIYEEKEAELGFMNRARYAIEPIQSNRKALLEQELGKENIMEDKNGDLYLKQNGAFLPLNKKGVSAADFADIGGALPEMIGGAAGAVAGAVGGAGVASVPGAIALGAVGGGLGSAARQGLSAMLGTPQVATMGERAMETGLSTVVGGAGAGLGIAAKSVVDKYKPGLKQFLKNIGRDTTKDIAETTIESVGRSEISAGVDLAAEYAPKTKESIMGKVSFDPAREAVENERAVLDGIAERQGIEKSTYAQAAQGPAIFAEAELIDTPIIGRGARKYADKQTKKIKENIEKEIGDFLSTTNDDYEVGVAIREASSELIKRTKGTSSALYNAVDELGIDADIGKRVFLNKFRDKAGDLGLINPDLSRAVYAADTELTRGQFQILQDVVFDGLTAIQKNPSDKIKFKAANALRKTVKANAEELRVSNPTAARLVEKFGRELDVTIEGILNREHPNLGKTFAEANKGWAKYKGQEEVFDSLFKGGKLDDEKVVRTIMGGTNNVKQMQELLGEESVKEVAKTHVRNILLKLGDAGIGRAESVAKELRGLKSAPIKMALGEKAHTNLMENIYFLNSTGQSLKPVRQSMLKMMFSNPDQLKSMAGKLIGVGKNYSTAKGITASRVAEGVVETTGKVIPDSKYLPQIANLLTEDGQRSFSSGVGKAEMSVTQKEIERRKRAISGSK